MRIRYKSLGDIQRMRESGLVLAEILDVLCAHAVPGISTWELDQIARSEIERHRVKSAFLGYYDYPAVLCTSVNEVVVHGIPSKEDILQDGDIVGIDFGIYKDGWCSDSARTVLVGSGHSELALSITQQTRNALLNGISQCTPGSRLGDIGATIQNYVEKSGFSVVRAFVGHGIGRAMHEDPQVPNIGRLGTGRRLKSGLVIAVEPMVNAGTHEIEVMEDQWTAVTKDRKISAHFEHTIAITDQGPWILTDPQSQL